MTELAEDNDGFRSIRIERVSEEEYEILWTLKGPRRTWKEMLIDLASESRERELNPMLNELLEVYETGECKPCDQDTLTTKDS